MEPEKYWKCFIAGLDAPRYAIHRRLPCTHHHLLIACMPKSGSTYLRTILSNLPGFKAVALVPGYGRREQELDTSRLLLNHRINYVAQHHVRFSEPMGDLLSGFGIKPIVLVRNIFDVVVSLRDHFRNESVEKPLGYAFPYMKDWEDERLEEFIAYMFIPWYFNFYLCWLEYKDKCLVRYEDLATAPMSVATSINSQFSLGVSSSHLKQAIDLASTAFSRKNKAIVGRGGDLTKETREHIYKMASFYKGVDFSLIGISS